MPPRIKQSFSSKNITHESKCEDEVVIKYEYTVVILVLQSRDMFDVLSCSSPYSLSSSPILNGYSMNCTCGS